MEKPKLTQKQLYCKLDEKGITFNSHSKCEVIEILSNRNYYYRLASYRKNYKSINGKYIDLDFKALVDIAAVDSYLREYLLALCLDVEHAAKTMLMRLITLNHNEDGYSLVEELKNSRANVYWKAYNNVEESLKSSKYKKDLRNKRQDKISVWVFLEFASLSDAQCLMEIYNNKYKNKDLRIVVNSLKYIRNIRNSCAHNNTYLVNIFDESLMIVHPSQESKKRAKELNFNKYWLHYEKTHDIIILFNLYNRLNSEELRNRRKIKGEELLDRANKNNGLHSLHIKGFFKILSNLVEKL